jgi:hypothetical protein
MNRANGIVKTAALSARYGPTLICGPSETRVALLFSPPVGGINALPYYTVSTDPEVALGAGINVTAQSGPVTITNEQFGDATLRRWYAVGSEDMTIGYLETVDSSGGAR